MNTIIQANARCIRQRDIPEIMDLFAYIQTLDKKYGVISSDETNSFGLINPDRMLISELYESNLYFSLFGYHSKSDEMPKYAYTRQSAAAGILYTNVTKQLPLQMEDVDRLKLISLREAAKEVAQAKFPKKPIFRKQETDSYPEFDQQLEEQGFATAKQALSISVSVPAKDGCRHRFAITFDRLKPNKKPHFSTAYDGWQNQEDMLETELAYQFYRKWNPFHGIELTMDEWTEMKQDAEEVEAHYTKKN